MLYTKNTPGDEACRAPIVEGAQAPTPEFSLRAGGQDASSWMARPLSVKVVMKEGAEEIIVLGLGLPQTNALETGTVEISAQAQGAPTTTQGMSTMEAAGITAPRQKIRLFPKETRPFNYAKIGKDEAPLLHTLGRIEHTSDDALAGNERTGDKTDKDAPVEADRMSSDGSDLGEQMDRLLNGGAPSTLCRGYNNDDTYEDENAMVDYDGETSDDGFKVDMSEQPNYLAREEAEGEEQSTTHVASDNSSEGQLSSEQLAASEQATKPVIRHENVVNARDKPVLTQQAITEIIKRQPQAVMQKVGWEQKKQTYTDLLSGYESPNGTSMNVAVGLTALMFGSAVSEHAQMISLMAQSEASDKLAKQAERHRELLEKEFTQSMERMKAEHEKTISEAIKSRDKYARSAYKATNSVEQTMQKIDQAQCDKMINFQLECLKKRALKSEQELQDITEKFEEEITQKGHRER